MYVTPPRKKQKITSSQSEVNTIKKQSKKTSREDLKRPGLGLSSHEKNIWKAVKNFQSLLAQIAKGPKTKQREMLEQKGRLEAKWHRMDQMFSESKSTNGARKICIHIKTLPGFEYPNCKIGSDRMFVERATQMTKGKSSGGAVRDQMTQASKHGVSDFQSSPALKEKLRRLLCEKNSLVRQIEGLNQQQETSENEANQIIQRQLLEIKSKTESIDRLTQFLASKQRAVQILDKEKELMLAQINVLKGSFRVFLRVRPFDSRSSQTRLFESKSITDRMISLPPKRASINPSGPSPPKKRYIFDRIFRGNSTQENIFSCFKSYFDHSLYLKDVSIFAYGQTGAGKTFSVNGPPESRLIGSANPKAQAFAFAASNTV